jgi:hypothetical protein
MNLTEAVAFFSDKTKAFQQTFQVTQPANIAVMVDLAKFCRAGESTFNPDARIAANLDGRREVWLHIQKYLHLTPEQLVQISNGNSAAVYERLPQ